MKLTIKTAAVVVEYEGEEEFAVNELSDLVEKIKVAAASQPPPPEGVELSLGGIATASPLSESAVLDEPSPHEPQAQTSASGTVPKIGDAQPAVVVNPSDSAQSTYGMMAPEILRRSKQKG